MGNYNRIARDGKEQPHVHLMFSDRQIDGIEQWPEQFFKRYNSKQPERGGAQKFSYGANKHEAALAYEQIRERWARAQNQALEHVGVEARVDHRSLADQGIEREPQVHREPAVSGIEAQGQVSEVGERRQAQGVGRRLLDQARALRQRLGQELTRVKEWVKERFIEPDGQLKEHALVALKIRGREAAQGWRTKLHERQQTLEREARDKVLREKTVERFQELVVSRSKGRSGFTDRGAEWRETPETLRKATDRFRGLSPATAPVAPYRPRAVTQLGNWQVEQTDFKIYGLLADGRLVTQEVLADAEQFVRSELPAAISAEDCSNGLGFVIIHPGEQGVSVLAHWWIQGSVLCQRIQRKLYGARAPLPARPVVACVWELGLIEIEQQIWRSTMMGGMPNAAAYLSTRAQASHV